MSKQANKDSTEATKKQNKKKKKKKKKKKYKTKQKKKKKTKIKKAISQLPFPHHGDHSIRRDPLNTTRQQTRQYIQENNNNKKKKKKKKKKTERKRSKQTHSPHKGQTTKIFNLGSNVVKHKKCTL